MPKNAVQWGGLLLCVAACWAAAGLGALFTGASVGDWYATLRKPAWTPPDGAFGPVWAALYLMMAVAAWLVWRRAGWQGAAVPLALFGLQLVLNAAWSGLFFGLRSPGAAFAEIVALWGAIVATTLAFGRASPAAAWLMVPYLVWVTFAAGLNYTIWRMN